MHLLLGVALFATRPAAADPSAAASRTSVSGLDGLVNTAWPVPQPVVGVAGTAGYAMRTSFPDAGDGSKVHSRLDGTLAAGWTPEIRYVSVALRLDARVDLHPSDATGDAYGSGVGDPRFILRGGYPISDEWQVGADATLWVPGESAPSVDFSALTTDLRALGVYEPSGLKSLSVLAAAGYRLDYSSRAAPDLDRLRPGDRTSLGLSSFDSVLLGLGVNYQLTPKLALFGEFSGELLVGSGAPSMAESPMRVSLGARHPLGKWLMGEVQVNVGLSQRPSIDPSAPLIPIEPRFGIRVGLRFGKSLKPPVVEAPAPPPVEQPVEQPVVTMSTVSGQVLDEQGRTLPDAQVTLQLANGEVREVLSDAEGRYVFAEVPHGTAEGKIVALGYDESHFTLEVTDETHLSEPVSLVPHEAQGTLRGLARSFASEPIKALVRVTDMRGRKKAQVTADEEGRFEVTLPPGEFKVRISAPGYTSQRRTISINDNGVTVLNVDLRERK